MKASVLSCVTLAICAVAYAETRHDVPLEPGVLAAKKQAVVWGSPSADARGSMPLGNGDIGVNVWVEPSGDLVLLLGKSDSFDEFNRLLKIGRIRIRTTPSLVSKDRPFSQALRLEDGAIEIKAGDASLHVWVDANRPVVQVDLSSATPVAVELVADNWRKENRALENEGPGMKSNWGNWPDKMRVNADTVLPAAESRIGWCHRNVESQWRKNLELTALGDEIAKGKDPVLGRSFGALVRAPGTRAESDTVLRTTTPVVQFKVQVVTTTDFSDSPEAWSKAAQTEFEKADRTPDGERFAAHRRWWRNFWNRSWIHIDEDGGQPVPTATYPGKLCLGIDTAGGNPFRGTLADPVSLGRELTAEEIARLAQSPHGDTPAKETPDVSLHGSFTFAAWVRPVAGERGRLFDKSTPATANGLLFDTEPGNSLRYNLGGSLIQREHCLKPDTWQHVAATFNSQTGEQRLYLDGKLIASKQLESNTMPVTRAYTLQRFVTACAGRGKLPIKFNGSLFTVDGRDPDFRAWGGGYWWQNTREAYWAMPYAGDYDMMEPLFRMYREALPLRMAATRKYYNHDGAFYPETLYFWGNYMDAENYGINRNGKPDGLADNGFIRRYWQGGLELVAMMLDAYDGTRDAQFREQTLLPIAKQITLFFDQHWQRGTDGKIVFDPAQSLETWHKAKNPLPEIAGLRFVLPRLLALPADDATKAQWRKLLADLPPVPTALDKDGNARLAPADTFSNKANIENPELYAVFPYRLFTALSGPAELVPALNAWSARLHKVDRGWQQNCIQAPLLGLAAEAKTMITARAAATAAGYRFPGFFGPNYDWTPEQCHGTNMQTGLQRMLMQCEGDRILLLPAWPKDWNASFKLHAPRNTTIEGRVENGTLRNLVVTPENRSKNIEIREAR